MSADRFSQWQQDHGEAVTVHLDGAEIVQGSRSAALAIPHAEVLLNGRCVGHTELDERYGTVLVIDWHDPAGCEHLA